MNKIKTYLRRLGPGFITGAADDDPSGIATYSQTGAMFAFVQLWTMFFALPLMIAVQEMCGRIGLVTGKGIAGVIKQHYSKKILYIAVTLLLIANVINIGADLGAMASSAQLIFHIPFVVLIFLMLMITLFLEIVVSYKVYSQYLKYLAYSLLAYIITAFIIHVDWTKAIYSLIIPHIEFNKDYYLNIVALFGTTISPYLFFWQAGEEVEEEVAHHKLRTMGVGVPKITPKDITNLRFDTIVGMLFSQAVTFFIIITAGATLYPHNIRTIQTASDAAEALRPLAGNFAFVLFALGIISTGFLAVPVLSGSASYALCEVFNWNEGFYRKFKKAHEFYEVITAATLIGLCINFIGIDPIKALYYSAAINGLIAPPLLVIILLIANNKTIMKTKTNPMFINFLGILAVVVMGISAIGLIIQLL